MSLIFLPVLLATVVHLINFYILRDHNHASTPRMTKPVILFQPVIFLCGLDFLLTLST